MPPSDTSWQAETWPCSIAARTKADAVLTGIGKGHVQAYDIQPHFHGVRFKIVANGHSVEAELPVPGVHLARQLGYVVHGGRTLSRAAQAFIGLLQAEASSA